MLSLDQEQLLAQEHSLPRPCSAGEMSPRRSSFSPPAAASRTASPGTRPSSRSPLSPLDTETFNWPDVRELCSKYASQDEAAQAQGSRPRGLPVSRSCSVPNMVEPPPSGRLGRCRSLRAKRGRVGSEAAQPQSPGGLSDSWPDGEEALHVTADLALENNQRVIIMERRPLPGPASGPSSPAAVGGQGQDRQASAENWLKEEGPRDPGDPSQQGRVRNLREKFQALNSVG